MTQGAENRTCFFLNNKQQNINQLKLSLRFNNQALYKSVHPLIRVHRYTNT